MRPSSCLFLVALMAVTKRALGCTLNTTAINARVLSNCGAELAACGTNASSFGTCMSFGGACGVSGCISKLVAELIDDYYNEHCDSPQCHGNIGSTSPEYQAISACYREAKCPPESDATSVKEAADKKKEAADKKELAGIVDTMMGAMALLGLDDAASSILKGGVANLDLEGAQSLMTLGLGIMASGGDDVMSVFGNKDVVGLLIKYKVDVKALTLALNNPFVTDGGVEKVDLEKATKALNLTADMSTLMDSVIDAIPAETLKAIMTKMAASKDDYLTSYGTLDYAKFLDDATVKAAIVVYTSANPAAGIEGLLTSVSAATASMTKAGNSLNPESGETPEDPDASGASATAAGIVSVAAAVFMAL